MLEISKLKENLLKKYERENSFYELALPSSYPYEVKLGAPTSKELLHELSKVRAWQSAYEQSILAPFLCYKEHKARGALGNHWVLEKVVFPNAQFLEKFILSKAKAIKLKNEAPYQINSAISSELKESQTKFAPSSDKSGSGLGRSLLSKASLLSHGSKAKSNDNKGLSLDRSSAYSSSTINTSGFKSASVMDDLGLAQCFNQFVKDNDLEFLSSPESSKEQANKSKACEPNKSLAKENLESLSDKDFLKLLDGNDKPLEAKLNHSKVGSITSAPSSQAIGSFVTQKPKEHSSNQANFLSPVNVSSKDHNSKQVMNNARNEKEQVSISAHEQQTLIGKQGLADSNVCNQDSMFLQGISLSKANLAVSKLDSQESGAGAIEQEVVAIEHLGAGAILGHGELACLHSKEQVLVSSNAQAQVGALASVNTDLYVIGNEVLCGVHNVKVQSGALRESERTLGKELSLFECFYLLLARIQEPLYNKLSLNQDKLAQRNQGLNDYIKRRARTIALLGAEFWVIVQFIDYLASLEQTPNIYVRQVSLPLMDTKFVERHYTVINELLTLCLPQDRNLELKLLAKLNEEDVDKNSALVKTGSYFNDFLRRWGFAYKKEMIRWRMLDPNMSLSLYGTKGSMLDSTVPLEAFANLDLKFEHVIICENEVCYLNLPPITNSIAIFGGGYKVASLGALKWLEDKDIIYWGDIDTHGFQILHSLRLALNKSFSASAYDATLKVRAMLMNKDVLNDNPHAIVKESDPICTFLSTLKGAEYSCYETLISHAMGDKVRLEQELIPFDQVLTALKAMLPDEQIFFDFQHM